MRFDLPTFEDSAAATIGEGVPLQLPVDAIDEDPEQPRQEFDAHSLQELAATIAERGIRQPVSVRPHPVDAGRWMLNFGARRLRASVLAGKAVVPAFVDLAIDSYDQVIENEQREGLKPLELALFVKRQLAVGVSQAEIARRLGKSRPYVTMACALIDAPDWLMEAYRQGKCRGLTELYELRRLHSAAPDPVEQMVTGRSRIVRSDIEALRAQVKVAGHPDPAPGSPARDTGANRVLTTATRTAQDNPKTTPVTISAHLGGRTVRVDVVALPEDSAEVFVIQSNGRRVSAPIKELEQIELNRDAR